jgi:hypothetical protein
MLEDIAGYCRASSTRAKPTVLDEDNTASMYRDTTGWTIHRKRAWTALLNGCHYDYIDFSITVGSETGTLASQAGIRTWMDHLSQFISSFDVVHSKLAADWIAASPQHLTISGLTANGSDFIAYLADSRELSDSHAGDAIKGTLSIHLPAGNYDVSLFSPTTGGSSPAIRIKGGALATLTLPLFNQDIAVRATRVQD